MISGKKSSDSAIRSAINELVTGGTIKVEYPSGRKVNIASALSTNVRTGVKQATMDITEDMGHQLGATHWEVSAHADCADDHLWLQGIVVKDGSAKYRDVLEALKRPNCRHSISPFFKGWSKKTKWDLPSKNKIKTQYAQEQYENRVTNARRKVRLQEKLDRQILSTEGKISKYVNKTITQVERLIANDIKENMVVFDRSGKAILDLIGDEDSVNIPKDTMRLLERGNYNIVHNHPDTGGSFSPADLKIAASTKSLEIGAVDNEWIYIAKPRSRWIDPGLLRSIHEKNISEAMDVLRQEITKIPELTEGQQVNMWREAYHEATQKTAREADIIYIRKKRK